MATLDVVGLDDLQLSFQELIETPETVFDAMLEAEADVVVPEQKKQARAFGVYDPESNTHIADKISSSKATKDKDGRKLFITFKGSRRRGNTSTRNAEIAFINEYGKTGQAARPFIATSIAKSEAKAAEAAEKVYDEYLSKKNL